VYKHSPSGIKTINRKKKEKKKEMDPTGFELATDPAPDSRPTNWAGGCEHRAGVHGLLLDDHDHRG
jgi:hypothetical protein